MIISVYTSNVRDTESYPEETVEYYSSISFEKYEPDCHSYMGKPIPYGIDHDPEYTETSKTIYPCGGDVSESTREMWLLEAKNVEGRIYVSLEDIVRLLAHCTEGKNFGVYAQEGMFAETEEAEADETGIEG